MAPFIISTLYGDAYTGAERIFAVHIWACLFVYLGVARSHYLINEGLTRFSFFTTALGAAVNVGLNLVLIPRYEGMGAAVASVISYAASGYLSSFVYPRLFETGIMQSKAFVAPVRYVILYARKRSWV